MSRDGRPLEPLEPLATAVGHAGWGENRHFGFDVGRELVGRESLSGLLALAVCGRRFSAGDQGLLDDVAAAMTVTDPRIWPLKLTRVVSSYGRCLSAVAAVNICIERALVGHWTSGDAAALLLEIDYRLRALDHPPQQEDDTQDEPLVQLLAKLIAKRGRLMGFGVPFRDEDERVVLVAAAVERRGRRQRRYWQLLERVSKVMRRVHAVPPNIGLAVGAVCLDMGMTPEQTSRISVALGQNVYLANAIEGARQAPKVLQRLPSDRVDYQGRALRRSPRSVGQDQR